MTSVPQFCQEYITSLVRRPVFSLVRLIIVRPWPCRLAPAAGESCGAHICPIPCTPIPLWSSSKCRNTPSTNQLHVFSFRVGRSVLLNKDYCLNTSSSSKFFGQGGNAWNLLDFEYQSAAIVCVDTIKYYSIPSVPSRLEGVKTRPHTHSYYNTSTTDGTAVAASAKGCPSESLTIASRKRGRSSLGGERLCCHTNVNTR